MFTACGGGDSKSLEMAAENDRQAPVEPQKHWPEGTVLAVDDLTLFAAEVDSLAASIGDLYPAYVITQNRRLALTNYFLERLAVHSRDSEPRQLALSRCREALLGLRNGPEPPAFERIEGRFGEFNDIAFWAISRELSIGEWSEPFELTGRWILARLDRLDPGTRTAEDWLEVSYLSFPFLDFSYREGVDTNSSIRDAVDQAQLTIVDPVWTEYVPTEWKHRMGALDQ